MNKHRRKQYDNASNDSYPWDHHSDQPHVIRDRKIRRRLYRLGAMGSIKTLLVSLIALPVAWVVKQLSHQASYPVPASRIGLCINVESGLPEKTCVTNAQLLGMADELAVEQVLIRIPLAKAGELQPYIELAGSLAGRELLFDILQDRQHIKNLALLEQDLRRIFSAFEKLGNVFKIGNAVNRKKWAFTSQDEYFRFFRTAQALRDSEFPHLQLLGGGIIDFELPNFARSLLHCTATRYDGVAALLYVDRRGAPENRQLGENLHGKIVWFRALMKLSSKTRQALYLTETNWPLVNTEPFAPAVGDCMVDEHRQAAYLVRYYLLAMVTGQIEAIYWHQLVAPGYGLVDNRGNEIRKRRAFYAFKTLNQLFNNASIICFTKEDDLWVVVAQQNERKITAIWTNDRVRSFSIDALQVLSASSARETIEIMDLTGRALTNDSTLTVSGDVTYFIQQVSD